MMAETVLTPLFIAIGTVIIYMFYQAVMGDG